MKFSGFLSILVLLGLFANIQGLGLTDLLFPRRCPRFREHCELKERDLCSRDRDCQRKEKCCLFNCGKKCLDPQQDICSLPKDSGYCLAYFPRWFYNKENSTCQLFIYGGCQGNNNNFQSQSLCQNVCQKTKWFLDPPTNDASTARLLSSTRTARKLPVYIRVAFNFIQ
ncbi:eppin-like [Microtus pennsylvanicus]|uniref:eppin-like n=1 Tax=Microtus pennsylvanicus TaxID=10058 RepID=UPI003F6AED99